MTNTEMEIRQHENHLIDGVTPLHFPVTKRGNWLYCQMPGSANRKWLMRISTYVSTYQLNSIFVNAARLSPDEVLARLPLQEGERIKREKKEPKPDECPLVRWELSAGMNDSTATASDSSPVAFVTLAAAATLDEILHEQQRLLAMLDDSKKFEEQDLPTQPDFDPIESVLMPEAQAPAVAGQKKLTDMTPGERKLMINQLKARINNPAAAQLDDDPTLGINPLDLLRPKSSSSDEEST